MDITEQKNGKYFILGIAGRLDASTAGAFEQMLMKTIEAGEKDILVDFSNLDYISSSGLRVLLMGAKKLKGNDAVLNLCALKDHIKEVFDIAGFTPVFSIKPNVDAVLNG
ncbi:MAG: STAS domain-containing protein [Melioribacteraceae bacterium]|nr:STAS domain-containing protein [Melioribacteraceae bacterium]MCF8265128.1 STAS domain-containing protein [Melioribacteraceae bacterium]